MPGGFPSSSAVVMDYSAEWDSWAPQTAQGGGTGTRDVASWEVRSSRPVVIDRVTSPPPEQEWRQNITVLVTGPWINPAR